jgi:voltage-gated potassium channel
MYRLLVTVTLAVLAGGTIFYHLTEKWSLLNSYYFCVVTLTTVGYGDITPHTSAGKLFTTVYILVGIGILGAFVNTFVKKRTVKIQARAENRESNRKH